MLKKAGECDRFPQCVLYIPALCARPTITLTWDLPVNWHLIISAALYMYMDVYTYVDLYTCEEPFQEN